MKALLTIVLIAAVALLVLRLVRNGEGRSSGATANEEAEPTDRLSTGRPAGTPEAAQWQRPVDSAPARSAVGDPDDEPSAPVSVFDPVDQQTARTRDAAGATEPVVPEPVVPEPDVIERAATEPVAPAPEPVVPEPDVTEPEATVTEATEPDATEPDATEPDATEPDATEPTATEPEAPEPTATEPEAPEPTATEPEATEVWPDEPAGRRVSELDEVTDGGFGVGSAAVVDDGAMPLGHPVKAWQDTRTFRTPDAPGYDEAEPHLWFADEEAARRAGFTAVGEG